METLSAVCIGFGLLLIIGRSPQLFAPSATLRFFRRHFLSTDAQVRRGGLIPIMFAIVILYASLHAPMMTNLLQVFASVATLAGMLAFGFPSLFRRFFANTLDYFDDSARHGLVRIHGFFGVVVGILLVYMGVYVI